MSQEKPWLKNYPTGVPETIELDESQTLIDLLEKGFAEFGDRPAYENMGAGLSYRELEEKSRHFASYLRQDAGLDQGDRVAVMMPNILQYPVAVFGILRAGLIVVNTNPMYTARELTHQLTDSGAKAIVVVENFADGVAKVVAKTSVKQVIVTGIGDMLGFPKGLLTNFVLRHVKKMVPKYSLPGSIRMLDAINAGGKRTYQRPSVKHRDTAFLQYTGGTTGVAKGAMLSHRNLLANTLQASSWLTSVTGDEQEHIITALPLYHIFALTANCLVFFSFGGENHLITNPRDMPGFIKTLSNIPFTAITGVNTLFNGMLNTPGFADLDFSHLKLTLGGGMAVQRSVAEQWKSTTGCTLVEAYGLTETSPAACMNPMDLAEYNGSIGLPISSTDCCVQDDEGNMLPHGETGELCIQGPQVMVGYWQRPEATAETTTEDGWLKTGDVAVCDEQGFFRIVDRKKDMILVSGFNVYPNEIEDVVVSLEGVLEVAAIGIPDEKSGEAVKLCVVKSNPELTAEQIRAYCKENLTGYKVPRHIVFLEDLPKTNVGKILRRELREAKS